jgi:hypothetical protein
MRKGVTLKGRPRYKPLTENPGPQYRYDLNVYKKKSPSFSFGSKTHITTTPEQTPGPGSYDLPMKRGKAYSMKSRTYIKTTKDVTPGVGEYNLRSKNTGPKFSMTSRKESSIYACSTNPGYLIDGKRGSA